MDHVDKNHLMQAGSQQSKPQCVQGGEESTRQLTSAETAAHAGKSARRGSVKARTQKLWCCFLLTFLKGFCALRHGTNTKRAAFCIFRFEMALPTNDWLS